MVTAEMVWKIARNCETPHEGDHGYAMPLLLENAGKPALPVRGTQHLTIYHPQNGNVLWSRGNFNSDSE